jgi:hypothetical protein
MKRIAAAVIAAAALALAPGAGASKLPSVSCGSTTTNPPSSTSVLPAGSYFQVLVNSTQFPDLTINQCTAEDGVVITGGLFLQGPADFYFGKEDSPGPSGVVSSVTSFLFGSVQIHHVRFIKEVELSGGGNDKDSALTGNDFGADLTVKYFGNTGSRPFPSPTLRVANNTVAGSLRINKTGWHASTPVAAVQVYGNTIMGDLICGTTGPNNPPPTLAGGPPNVVFGMKLGECADL